MQSKKYQVLAYVAYGFYCLIGLLWFIASLMNGNGFSSLALFMIAIFSAQFYYKHLITNLILGIVLLFLSIYSLLEIINKLAGEAKLRPLAGGEKLFVAVPILSIVMAGILVFSYMKLSFSRE